MESNLRVRWSILLLFQFSLHVIAGNRFWESTTPSHHSQQTPHSIQRRAYYLDTERAGAEGRGYWREAKVPYCIPGGGFFSSAAKKNVQTLIGKGIELWHIQGLPSEIFEFYPADDKLCDLAFSNKAGAKQARAQVLEVIISKEPAFWATVGNDGNAQMTVSERSSNEELLPVVSNYAHEIGHVYGLSHEHQRHRVGWIDWDDEGEPDHVPRGYINFNCANLKDYAAFAASDKKRTNKKGHKFEMPELCRSTSAAYEVNFAAAQVIPDLQSWLTVDTSTDEGIQIDPDDVDWNSIMAYASIQGARKENGEYLNVYTRLDGTPQPFNRIPSARDVHVIRDIMYAGVRSRQVLVDIPASTKHKKFNPFAEEYCLRNN